MKTKLTTTERRAVALCESIRLGCQHPGESYTLTVEWIDSRTWGSNPRIMHRGEKCTNVSGCGYCKHSTALATALCHLGETEDQRHRIACTGGAGVSIVKQALAESGWTLESITSGKKYDVYTPAPVTPPTGPVDPLTAFLANPKPYNAATLERSMRVFIERWGPDYVGNLSVEIRGEGVGGPDLTTVLGHCIEHPPELDQLRRAVDLMVSGWERAKLMDLINEREATPSLTPEAPAPTTPAPVTL